MEILNTVKKPFTAIVATIAMALPTYSADTNAVVWTDLTTELNDVDPRLQLGTYIQNVSSNAVKDTVIPIVEEYVSPITTNVLKQASNITENAVNELARTNSVLSGGPYLTEGWATNQTEGGYASVSNAAMAAAALTNDVVRLSTGGTVEGPLYTVVTNFLSDGYEIVTSRVATVSDIASIPKPDYTTNNTELVKSIKEVAQEKLSNAQISAIDSVVDERKTVVTYTNGTTAEFDVEGELTNDIFPDKQIVESVKIGTAVTSISYEAFEHCEELRGVTLPNSITSIREYAFSGCLHLLSITIPNSVTNIGESAFHACYSITNITIPKSVTYIGSRAFENTEELTSCIFEGKSIQEVQEMANYPWDIYTPSIITTWNEASKEWVETKIPMPVAPSTDESVQGKPADAKATGDALAGKLSTSGGFVHGLLESSEPLGSSYTGLGVNGMVGYYGGIRWGVRIGTGDNVDFPVLMNKNGGEIIVPSAVGMLALLSDIYAATNNVLQKGEDIDMGGVIDETTSPPTYESSAFIKFIDMWLGYGVEGSGFGIYKNEGGDDPLTAAYLFNDNDESGDDLDVMRRKDLTSVLATYETVSNAAMSAAAATNDFLRLTGGFMRGPICFPYFNDYGVTIAPVHPGALSFDSTYPDYSGLSAILDLTRIPTDDVGFGSSEIAFVSDIAFAPVSPTEQTGSYQLADRSVNAVDITDNQVLIMPAPISGKLRDLYVRAQFYGFASQANLSTNDIDGTAVSFEYIDGIIPMFDKPGTYLIHLMETAAGIFSVKSEGPMVEAQYDKRLEYVSSTGTQYVDTGIIGSSNTVIEIDMAGLSAVANVAMFGAINSENRHFMAMRYNNALRFIYGTSGSSGDISVPISFGEHTRHQFRFSVSDGGNVKIDVDGVNKVDVDTGISSTTGLPMFLFGCNRDSSFTYPATMSIYGCRIWKDGNLVRDYIPCMKDNRAALFDTVSHTLAYSNSGTDLEPAASTTEEASQFAGFSLPEYVSTLSKYKYDPNTRTCYREFMENDTFILRAVTNIDLTAVGNIDALKAMADSIEIRKPPVAQVCYSVGYESRDNVLVATNADFKIDGNYLSEAEITMSYDVSGTTTAEIISPTAITATSESITVAESALATVRSVVGRSVTFAIQTAYGHTSITAVVAAPPTP